MLFWTLFVVTVLKTTLFQKFVCLLSSGLQDQVETLLFRIATVVFLWFKCSCTKILNGICFPYHPVYLKTEV